MDPQEIKRLITGRLLSVPYSIRTRGGQEYTITDHANAWIAPAFPESVIIATRGEGIGRIGMGSIDSIHDEHES
jgi:hypothetical protein